MAVIFVLCLLLVANTGVTHALQCYECSTLDVVESFDEETIAAMEAGFGRNLRTVKSSEAICRNPSISRAGNNYTTDCTGVCLTGYTSVADNWVLRTCMTLTTSCADLADMDDETTEYRCCEGDLCNKDCRGPSCVAPAPVPTIKPTTLPTTRATTQPTTRATTQPTTRATTRPTTRLTMKATTLGQRTTARMITAPKPVVSQDIQCYECSSLSIVDTLERSNIVALGQAFGRNLTAIKTSEAVCRNPSIAPSKSNYTASCSGVCLTGRTTVENAWVLRTCMTKTKSCSDLSGTDFGTQYRCCEGNLCNKACSGSSCSAAKPKTTLKPRRVTQKTRTVSCKIDFKGVHCDCAHVQGSILLISALFAVFKLFV